MWEWSASYIWWTANEIFNVLVFAEESETVDQAGVARWVGSEQRRVDGTLTEWIKCELSCVSCQADTVVLCGVGQRCDKNRSRPLQFQIV